MAVVTFICLIIKAKSQIAKIKIHLTPHPQKDNYIKVFGIAKSESLK